ncbi:SDR family oxidoreductase [Brasilonema sp. UFV-L1]|uniref:SDR family oxidoreductase n=1 Tax=Brasilonema sp. UFV-L1 TaxID=2234130 RepID=UPI00145D99AA|nr:SDR family oxidoreductase [Brasilonema sp. UFV-L1]NMG09283.1 hypothetical protein [Brasilonema sp. UFV-L1]
MDRQSVFITGSNRGFGLELVRRYAALNCQVFGLVRNGDNAQALIQAVKGKVKPIIANVSADAAIEIIARELSQQTDKLDLLINNAGIAGSGSSLEKIDIAELRELMEVHCYGPIRCVKASWSLLRQTKGATIVNITSRLGSISNVASGAFDHLNISYSMRITKAAQNMFTACLYREARTHGISVYAVHPGRMRTRMGNLDADLTAEEAAKRFTEWLGQVQQKQKRNFGYFEPEAEEFSW